MEQTSIKYKGENNRYPTRGCRISFDDGLSTVRVNWDSDEDSAINHDCRQQLVSNVRRVAKFDIDEWEAIFDDDNAEPYIDIKYIRAQDGTLLDVALMLAYGGPTIWLHTMTDEIVGSWSTDTVTAYMQPGVGDWLTERIDELNGCYGAAV